MAFHPEKCSTLRISRSKNPYSKTYILKGHTLTTEDSTRYLGVELQSNMSLNKHIDQTIKKGNSMLGFLQRNLKVSNEQTKTAAYLYLVRPVLEYCCSVWSPYTQDYINKLEMVQRRAARYVTNRYRNTSSVTFMLEHLEWETLEARRAKYQLTKMFKIIHGLVDIPADDHLTAASTRTRAHHSHKFRHIPASTDYYKNSFFPKTIRPPGHLGRGSWFGTFQTGALQSNNLILYRADQCKYVLVISLCYAGGNSWALVPPR